MTGKCIESLSCSSQIQGVFWEKSVGLINEDRSILGWALQEMKQDRSLQLVSELNIQYLAKVNLL